MDLSLSMFEEGQFLALRNPSEMEKSVEKWNNGFGFFEALGVPVLVKIAYRIFPIKTGR